MAASLWHYCLLDQPRFVAEEGHLLGRPGVDEVEVVGSRSDIETVKVGGDAIVVIEGTLRC